MDWRKDKNIQAFVKHVRQRCKETKVKIKLVDDIFVGWGEIKCAGYFDSVGLELAAATKDLYDPNRWITLLAHEYNHLEQWAENSPIWTGTTLGDYDAYSMWDMWLNHYVELNEEQLTKYTNLCMEVELDCEKRTVETIKQWNLPFDIEEYTQRSNAYALQYQFVKKHRKWNIPGKAPSSLKEVYSLLSTKFDMDYYSPLPPEIEQAYMKCFYE
jgi:hypothetical protein